MVRHRWDYGPSLEAAARGFRFPWRPLQEMGRAPGDDRGVLDSADGALVPVEHAQSAGGAYVPHWRHAGDRDGGGAADRHAPAAGGPRSAPFARAIARIVREREAFSGADGADREAGFAGATGGGRGARNQ